MNASDGRAAVLDDLQWRRMIADHTDLDALRAEMSAGAVTYYGGFDPTAPSLHFGNLVLLLTMRRLQLAGHRPIGLVGGATGLVGDPSGRTSERTLNDPDVIAGWVEHIRSQVERYLEFGGPNGAVIVNNLDWTARMTAIDWLRDIGKHFSVSRMLAKESVSARLDAGGISYTEFSYQVMQAVDFLELHRRHGCMLQLGGSDQWGNLTAGVDLIRRVEGATVHALATPLITRPDGEKFGKSTGSTLWLDPALTSPFAFYQWFLNVDDSVVGTYLRVFSFRPHEEIEALEAAGGTRGAARPGRGDHDHGARSRCGRRCCRRCGRALRPGRVGIARCRDPRGGFRGSSAGRRCLLERHADGARPARRIRPLREPRPGPPNADGRRGVREQRSGDRRGGRARPERAARRPLAAAAPR
jgi:tyrosyl-tRNA synthetase